LSLIVLRPSPCLLFCSMCRKSGSLQWDGALGPPHFQLIPSLCLFVTEFSLVIESAPPLSITSPDRFTTDFFPSAMRDSERNRQILSIMIGRPTHPSTFFPLWRENPSVSLTAAAVFESPPHHEIQSPLPMVSWRDSLVKSPFPFIPLRDNPSVISLAKWPCVLLRVLFRPPQPLAFFPVTRMPLTGPCFLEPNSPCPSFPLTSQFCRFRDLPHYPSDTLMRDRFSKLCIFGSRTLWGFFPEAMFPCLGRSDSFEPGPLGHPNFFSFWLVTALFYVSSPS